MGKLGALAGLVGMAALLSVSQAEAARGCGSRGGPGIRGANGRCLSWAQVGGYRSSPTVTAPRPAAPSVARPMPASAPLPLTARPAPATAPATAGSNLSVTDLDSLLRLWERATPQTRAAFLQRVGRGM